MNPTKFSLIVTVLALAGFVIVAWMLSGCAPTLVAKYDHDIDAGLSEYNQDVHLIIASKLYGSAFDPDLYVKPSADLSALSTRANGIGSEQNTLDGIVRLTDQLGLLRTLDSTKAGILSITKLGAIIDTTCAWLIHGENVKVK